MLKKLQGAMMAGGMAALLLAGPAQALSVGEIKVNSTMGQSFNASIPIKLDGGEDIYPGCVTLEDSPNTKYRDIPALKEYTLKVERNGPSVVVRITTNTAMSEPAFRVGLVLRCGAKVSTAREYMITQTPPSSASK